VWPMTSTVVVSIGAIVLLLAVLGGGAVALFVYLQKVLVVRSDPGEALEVRMAGLELKVNALPSIWEDERNRAKRSADAARKARKDAEDQLDEVKELIEANVAVPGGDETFGPPGELLPMPTRLGDPTPPDRRERVAAVAHLMR